MLYTQEQINKANDIDLVEWLKARGECFEKSGSEYRWKKHDSVTIRENRWWRHSAMEGGYPVDFVMYFYGSTFPEAVEMLTGMKPQSLESDYPIAAKQTMKSDVAEKKENFRLPQVSNTSDNLYRYLGEVRGISKEVIDDFLSAGDIYEDAKHHNVIFVGRDEQGLPAYAHAKGTKEKFRQDIKGSRKEYGFGWQSIAHDLFVFEAPVDLLSFISVGINDWQMHNYLSLGGVSDKALIKFLEERTDIKQIYFCLDNDEAGINATSKICRKIPKGIKVMALRPVLKDWNEVLLHKAEITGKMYEVLEYHNEKTVSIVRMSEVETQAVQWLWKPFIPFGKVTIVQGNPGEGKTTFALRLAAACTNHKLFPGMDDLEPFNVIYQTAEDGLGDTVKPRLLEAEADLSKVLVIDESEQELSFSDSRIERAIIQNHARLLILDPMQAYVGEKTDMNRANEIRPLFRKLADIAERTGCAIVLIGHLNKSTGGQTAYRGLGSIDFRAAARSVLLIGRVKREPNVRVIIHDKSSLAPEGKPMAFSLGDDTGFEQIGEYEITADDLLSGRGGETENKEEQAKQFILDLLGNGAEVSSDEIDKAASDMGIAERTVRKAKSNLRIDLGDKFKSKRKGTQWYHWIEK